MTPTFLERRRLRGDVFLGATILAVAHHLGGGGTGVTCDELAAAIGVGRGRIIRACDELARTGYLEKDRGVVTLTAKAVESLQPDGSEAA